MQEKNKRIKIIIEFWGGELIVVIEVVNRSPCTQKSVREKEIHSFLTLVEPYVKVNGQ